jgi:hypothetical protein
MSPVTSTIRTKGCHASCFRSKMFVGSASRSTVIPAIPSRPSKATTQTRPSTADDGMLTCSPHVSATGSVSGAGVAMQTVESGPRAAGPRGHCLHERFVGTGAVRAHNGVDCDRVAC